MVERYKKAAFGASLSANNSIMVKAGAWPHCMTVASTAGDSLFASLELDFAVMEAFAAHVAAARQSSATLSNGHDPAACSPEERDSLLRRLWAAAAIFMERLSATDAVQRQALLQHTASRFPGASSSAGDGSNAAAAALEAAAAALSEQLQHPAFAALLQARQQLLGLLVASPAIAGLVPADAALTDVLEPVLVAMGAFNSTTASSAQGLAASASVASRRWQAARSATVFDAILRAAQADGAAAVREQRASPWQLAQWRHAHPQVRSPRKAHVAPVCHPSGTVDLTFAVRRRCGLVERLLIQSLMRWQACSNRWQLWKRRPCWQRIA